MTRKEFKTIMVEQAGVVRKNEDGWYCTVCKGKSLSDDPWEVMHETDCTFCVALAALVSLMPKQEITPEVEN